MRINQRKYDEEHKWPIVKYSRGNVDSGDSERKTKRRRSEATENQGDGTERPGVRVPPKKKERQRLRRACPLSPEEEIKKEREKEYQAETESKVPIGR